MTISTAVRTAGPYLGNGVTTDFAFAFKVLAASDLLVVRTDTASGVETTLTITTDYTVTLNGDQDVSPGGTVTLGAALGSGKKLTISSAQTETQPLDLASGGAFYAENIETALDRVTILLQQLREAVNRSIKVPISLASGIDTDTPVPTPLSVLGWDSTGTRLESLSASGFATVAAYGTAQADVFSGDGAETSFGLTANPGALANLDVSISGVTQRPTLDYTWSGGTTLTFASPPASGTNNILVRYMQGLEQGTTAANAVTVTDSGGYYAGLHAEAVLAEIGAISHRWHLGAHSSVTGDGTTNDAAAIQALLDAAEAAGGGTIVVPWPSVEYNLGTTGIDIPDRVALMAYGRPGVTSGAQQFAYSGTGAAVRCKTGEGNVVGFSRALAAVGIGVRLTTASATGFRVRHARDVVLDQCAVRQEADNQIGFHLQGEAVSASAWLTATSYSVNDVVSESSRTYYCLEAHTSGTFATDLAAGKWATSNKGVFDTNLRSCRSYTSSASFTGALHYKLSGTTNNGQCNANMLEGCRGGGAGSFCEVGASNTNFFSMCEAEALTGYGFDFLSGANENGIHDFYIEGQSGWSSYIMRTHASASRNYLEGYVAGVNIAVDDLSLTATNYARWSGQARTYASASTGVVVSARVPGDADDRFELRPDGLRLGDGTAAPDKVFGARDKTVVVTDLSSAGPTATVDTASALIHSIRLQAGASGTCTIAAPTNSVSEGEIVTFHLLNSSGGAITLSWNAAYIVNGSFPTSIANGARITLQATRISSQWVLTGAAVTM